MTDKTTQRPTDQTRQTKQAIVSLAVILSSAAFSIGAKGFQSRMQEVKQAFQQLGQDLQSGNLSARSLASQRCRNRSRNPRRTHLRKAVAL